MSVSHLKAGKAKDSAGVTGGVSTLKPLNVNGSNPSESSDGSAPGFKTSRITKNPSSESASKNGKSFDIC
jgi:hypothetical protein